MKQRWLLFVVLGLISSSLWGVLQPNRAPGLSPAQREQARRAAVFERRYDELMAHPDVFGLIPTKQGIRIITDRPETMPTEIEGIPVVTKPPPDRLPPPPGVILLKPNGTREQRPELGACPQGYNEHQKYRWRFCVNIAKPQPIPEYLLVPSIAGVPYYEALAIHERHKDELFHLPGVLTVGLSAKGIMVRTEQPKLVPLFVEGFPVLTELTLIKDPVTGTVTRFVIVPLLGHENSTLRRSP